MTNLLPINAESHDWAKYAKWMRGLVAVCQAKQAKGEFTNLRLTAPYEVLTAKAEAAEARAGELLISEAAARTK